MADATPMSPTKLDLKRDERLRVVWPDGREDIHSIADLRRLCPCAQCKMDRDGTDPHRLMRPARPEEMEAEASEPKPKRRSLSVVPERLAEQKSISVTRAEPIGNYALKLHFSDGHASGIYSWAYLRELR
jgi:DUF971 family protein